ncbi:uncharacterized protein LOC144595563 [Rhinoraja longicauda]
MIVLMAAFISLCASISSKVCSSAATCRNAPGHMQILYPCNNTIEAIAGSKLEITCRVLSDLHTVGILVYWLANHAYIEDYSKDNRVKENKMERRGHEKSFIEVTLSFSQVERKDFEVIFSCVMLSGKLDQERFISIKPVVSNGDSQIAIAVAVVASIILVSVLIYKLLKFKSPQTYVIF